MPDANPLRRLPLILEGAFGAGLTAGCTRAPSFDVVGSLFPAWLICLMAGILLAVFARSLCARFAVAIAFPVLAFPCLAALFTFLLWLVFFS